NKRDLPAPAVRSVVAAVEEVSLFGERCAQEAERLQLATWEELSVLGDGADWVWNLSARHFPGAEGVLDVWHGAEHIADGAKAACEQSDEVAKEQAERGKQRLLAQPPHFRLKKVEKPPRFMRTRFRSWHYRSTTPFAIRKRFGSCSPRR